MKRERVRVVSALARRVIAGIMEPNDDAEADNADEM